jgi:hypothetical protein
MNPAAVRQLQELRRQLFHATVPDDTEDEVLEAVTPAA